MVQCVCLKTNKEQCTREASFNPSDNKLYCWQHQICLKPLEKQKIPISIKKIPQHVEISAHLTQVSEIKEKKKLSDFFLDNQISVTDINNIDLKLFIGPITNSNWIIRDKILAGCYPLTELDSLKKCNLRDVICLQTPEELNSFIPYIPLLNEDIVNYHNFPIPDQGVVDDQLMIEYMKQIILVIKLSKGLTYIHCKGGHGRTGVVVALLLGYIYNLSCQDALDLTQKLHDARWINEHKKSKNKYIYKSPQTKIQFNQVKRLVPLMQKFN